MARCIRCHHRLRPGARCPRDGWEAPAPTDAPPDLPEAPILPGFEVLGLLGTGGFAAVWEACPAPPDHAHAHAETRVAIKVGHADGAALAARFQREAEVLTLLAAIPGGERGEESEARAAPRLFAHGRLADGRPYLALERIAAPTLAAWLEARAAPPQPGEAVTVVRAIVAALAAIHARGVTHRDLKPENIFFDEARGSATLIDFGLARGESFELARALTGHGAAAGTLEYMAPEQLRGDLETSREDARVDVYAMGALLYELVTLRPPFVGDAAAVEYGHIALRPERPSALTPVPLSLERLILACLAKDPARRPQDSQALQQALTEIAAELHPGAAGVTMSAATSTMTPSPRGAPPSAILAEGRRHAVVLAVETPEPPAAVLAVITARRGSVVRQRRRRYLAVFSGADAEAPIDAALEAARELTRHPEAGAALHLAEVTIRPRAAGQGDGPPAVHGPAVDRPETWMPAGPLRGVSRTEAFDRVAPSPVAEPPLVGRGAVIAAVDAGIDRARAGLPSLVTLLGDHGLGKTRLAAEAAARIAGALPEACVIALNAGEGELGAPHPAARALFAALGGAIEEAPTHRVDLARALEGALLERARGGDKPVAVVLDEAHRADDAILDALERATREGPAALLVIIAAHPRLDEVRRAFGARAEHHARLELGPLDLAAGMELTAALLAPAAYPPAAALEAICTWAGGNPACLVELTRALKEAGVVRRRAENGSYYLATTELSRLPASPAWQWIAARTLTAMPREIAACVRLAALLGAAFTRAELEHLQEALERSGEASTPVDAGVALGALCARGLLAPLGEERFAFRSAVLGGAIRATLDEAQRARIHAQAQALVRAEIAATAGAPERAALTRLAHHAAAAGDCAEAAKAHLELGERARAAHAYVAADEHYTSALEQLARDASAVPEDAAEDIAQVRARARARARARSLAGRGKVRYRVLRNAEALADLAEARRLAEAAGERALLADVMLEEATALDWDSDFSGSAKRVATARPLVEALEAPELEPRLLVAEGRVAWRRSRAAEAVELLGEGERRAEASGDHEARVIALLLLSCALVVVGRLDEAEARFDEVIALAEEARDGVHLCSAYGNRFFLWSVRKDVDRAIEDLRRSMELAREIGNPWPERTALINLAELLFWCGRDAESLPLAERARALEERFMTRPVQEGSLMLARLAEARGDREEAARLVAWIAEHCPPESIAPGAHTLHHALSLLAAGGFRGEAWEALLVGADALVPAERLEVLYWRARAATLAGRRDEAAKVASEAEALIDAEGPGFRARFAALG